MRTKLTISVVALVAGLVLSEAAEDHGPLVRIREPHEDVLRVQRQDFIPAAQHVSRHRMNLMAQEFRWQ